ncbi:MAG: tetratricopeptide repeat protein [Candidatus Rokuibacteriota bacterium]
MAGRAKGHGGERPARRARRQQDLEADVLLTHAIDRILLELRQDHLGEAEGLYSQALAIREQTDGVSSTGVARVLDAIAELYETQSRASDAEPLLVRAVRIRAAAGDAFDHSVTRDLERLVAIRLARGEAVDARTLRKRLLRRVLVD